MAYIYKIVNNINDKIYIGKTESSLKERWREHCSDYIKNRNEKRPLYSAMRKYGTDNFHMELIEETDNPEEREVYWIEYYGSFKYGYNATRGGDGRAYVDVELILKLWNEGKTNREIQRITGYDTKTIRNHLRDNGISDEERKNRGNINKMQPVAKLNKDTEEIIEVFPSITAAAKSINKPPRHIGEVCRKERKTAYGYKWKFL